MPVTILHTRDGQLDDADVDVLSALKRRLESGRSKILLHLHGGLVDEAAGMVAAQRLSGAAPSGFNAPADWEQIYVVWRTGGLETLRTNWKDVFENDRLYRTLLTRLMSFMSGMISIVIPTVGARPAPLDG